VREVKPAGTELVTLVLDVPDWPGHRAGQHVDIRLTADDGYQAQRSYSIGSAPEDDGVEITVEDLADGEVSPYLTEVVRPGDQFEVRGPIGGYFTWSVEQGGPIMLVGGGSGLVPLMAMLRHRQAHGSTADVRVLISARAPDRAPYADAVAALGPREGLRVEYTYTRMPPEGWSGWARRVDADMLLELGPPPADEPRCFVCGPTPFVERVTGLLVEAGHEPARIHAERFGASGG
jgi:ferredoxin-NADP reductase